MVSERSRGNANENPKDGSVIEYWVQTKKSVHRMSDNRMKQHIVEYSATEFVVGHYSGFDCLAASAAKEVRRYHQNIRLILLLPQHPAEQFISCRWI